MHVVIWRFRPRVGSQGRFREAYGVDGSWSKLFRKSPDHLGTELLCAASDSQQYLTIDRWRSAKSYEAFLSARRDEYDALDRACEDLTEFEEFVGRFDSLC